MTEQDGEYSFAAEFKAFLPKKRELKTRRPRVGDATSAPTPAMGAVASVATYPPLGQVTQLASGEVTFYAVLETKKEPVGDGAAAAGWQVALWHTSAARNEEDEDEYGSGAEWIETQLQPISKDGKFVTLQDADPSVVRHYFRASVTVKGLLHFTTKFREAASEKSDDGSSGEGPTWRWVRDEQQMDDGTVVVNAQLSGASWPSWIGGPQEDVCKTEETQQDQESLADLIKGLNSAFEVKSLRSQCPGTQLWSLDISAKGAEDDKSSFTDVAIGLPWGDFLRWFAIARIWTPWLAPRHGRTKLDLDLDAVLTSFLSPGGRHLVFLAISGVNQVLSVFQSDESGNLVLNARNDSLDAEQATVLVAVGDSFETANAAVMYEARNLVNQMRVSSDDVRNEIQKLGDDVKPEWLENWYDGLGFCTWNALGQNLSEEKIVQAVDTLTNHGIYVASLIIDDNWQSLDRRGDGQFQYSWERFEADPAQFPNGLKHTIGRIREKHPHIQHIAVWHALLGYWGGISPDGELARRYKTVVVDRDHPKRRNLPVAGPMTVVAEEDVRRLYDEFYGFLADAGVDGVKTDAQFMMDTWVSAAARRTLTTTYQDAWTLATLRHFSIRAISCMSQTPPILFHSQMPQNRPAVLVRNSDDFFPDVPASHPWHVWTNAHNALLTQHLNILPDWDMFQTVHSYSGFHAAARCVSGGPVYITDVPGQHDLNLLTQMTGESVQGKTVVFRPSVLGRSLDQYVGFHDNVLLKVGCYHGNASTGTGILAAFNVSDQAVHEIVPLARVPGVVDDGTAQYVVRAHSSGHVTARPVRADALLTLSLAVYKYDIVSAYPALTFSFGHNVVHLANLGLVGKMAAAAAVVSTKAQQRADTGRVELAIAIKAPGLLGLYVSALADMRVTDHFLVTMRGEAIPAHCVAVSQQSAQVLEIDTARAWKELGFAPQWSNEVQLVVYVSLD